MLTSTVKLTKRSRRSLERSKGAKGDFEGLGLTQDDVDHLIEEEEDRNAEEFRIFKEDGNLRDEEVATCSHAALNLGKAR
jgi:hypothetical protein